MAGDLLLRGVFAGALAAALAYAATTLMGGSRIELAFGLEAVIEDVANRTVVSLGGRLLWRGAAGLAAYLTVGVLLGALVAFAFGLAWQRIGHISAATLGLLLPSMGFILLVLLPQLKYPPNPLDITGTFDGLRTTLYFEMVLISLGAFIVALLLGRALLGWLRPGTTVLIAAMVFVAIVVVIQRALPSIDEPADLPRDVLSDFQLASLATQFVLWIGLGLAFAGLAERSFSR
jgi:hypothetical protein